MRLNLTIIADYLENIEIIHRKIKKPFEFPLVTVRLPRPEEEFQEQYLYLVAPEELPLEEKGRFLSFLCMGVWKESDTDTNWEVLCLASGTDWRQLLNQVLDIFVRFHDWDQSLKKACYENYSLHEMGNIGLEVFQNGISCWDAQERMLFFSHNYSERNLPLLYPRMENEYLDEDMQKILSKTPMYQQALREKMPALYPAGTYETATLYYNLFDQDIHLAHLGIEPYVREFIPSDYSLLFHFGAYVKQALMKYNSLRIGGSREFDKILRKILEDGYFSERETEGGLQKYGWKMGDCYRCMALSFSEEEVMPVSLYGCMVYLMNLYSDIYIYKMNEVLLVIFHHQSSKKEMSSLDSLIYFLNRNDAYAGISNAFQGFGRLPAYQRQAMLTLTSGLKKKRKKRLYRFDDHVLEIMMENGMKEMPVQAYFTDAFRSLTEYDQEKNAELVKTLRTYLICNFNAAQAFETLHIHKTTFAYRMERIKQISGLDLKEYRTRLYLMLLFENF